MRPSQLGVDRHARDFTRKSPGRVGSAGASVKSKLSPSALSDDYERVSQPLARAARVPGSRRHSAPLGSERSWRMRG
jgi:hypothetical protein